MTNWGYYGRDAERTQPIERSLKTIYDPKTSVLPSDVLAEVRRHVRVNGKCGDPSPNEPLPDFYSAHSAAALKYCGDCPAKKACLVLSFDDAGRSKDAGFGVWAGLSANQRRKIYSAFARGADWETEAELAWYQIPTAEGHNGDRREVA